MIITNAVLNALRTSLSKTFDDTYKTMREQTFYRQVCFEAPASGRSNTYGWLGSFPQMREWIGDRVVKDLKEHSYAITDKLWEDTISVQRVDIEDDNLGMYTGLTQGLAEEAAYHPDKLVGALLPGGLSTLCYDGQNFFDTDHPVYPNHDGTGVAATVSNVSIPGVNPGPAWYLLDCRKTLKPFIFQPRMRPQFDALTNPNASDTVFMKDLYVYGARARHNVGYGFWQMAYMSRQPLNEANFRAARAAMRAFNGDGGRELGIRPSHIVIDGSLQSAAEDLFMATHLANGASNTLYKAVEIIDTDYLAAAA